jgi:hypothetical protein
MIHRMKPIEEKEQMPPEEFTTASSPSPARRHLGLRLPGEPVRPQLKNVSEQT